MANCVKTENMEAQKSIYPRLGKSKHKDKNIGDTNN